MTVSNSRLDGGGLTFDVEAINGYIDEIRVFYNGIRNRYNTIDEAMNKILSVSNWDSDTRDAVKIQYSVIQAYYDRIYSVFENILNFLETIVANYQLMSNLSFF